MVKLPALWRQAELPGETWNGVLHQLEACCGYHPTEEMKSATIARFLTWMEDRGLTKLRFIENVQNQPDLLKKDVVASRAALV